MDAANALPTVAPRLTLRRALAPHAVLLSNAGALATGTIATAALGFVYWWVAAQAFDSAAVGAAAAAVSMMTLLAQAGETGLGPLLIGQVPRRPAEAGPLISAALIAAGAGCLIASLAYVGLARALSLHAGESLAAPLGLLLFAAGVGATGLSLVVDQALVGLMRSATAMWRGVGFSAAKLALLGGVAACQVGQSDGTVILATWVAAQVASLVLLALLVAGRRGRAAWHRPRADLLRPLAGSILGHHAMNVALQAPALALPMVVTLVLSAQTNAAFYTSWAVLNVALLVPAALATVVYSTGSADSGRIASGMRVSLAASAAAGLAAALAFLFASPLILGLFNPAYPALAGDSLRGLGFGALAVGLKYHFVAVHRLRGDLTRASGLLAAGGILELAAAAAGAAAWGLTGLVGGWLGAVFLQAALMAPCVLTAARGGGSAQPAA